MAELVFLSIVIPARNEENRLPETLKQTFNFLESQPYQAEVIIVENGSSDRTSEVTQDYQKCHPNLLLLHEDRPGKGGAVKRGMLAASGTYRFMSDADLSMPVTEIPRFLPPRLNDFDLAIGSREAAGSIRYAEPLYRHLGGRAINLMIRLLALPGLQDTQCGYKAFHGPAAEKLFSVQTMTGWSFDIEILFVARRLGMRIVELPIPWYFKAETKVNPFQDALRMWADILIIRSNARRGFYPGRINVR